jgi:hypothetical protein
MSKDNALSFVGQIQTEHKAVLKADGEALKHAIECGKYLNLARENVESTKPKGKWGAWLKEHCPEILPRTERVYRQLATAVAGNPDIFADCDSIRSALAKLNEPKDDDEESKDDSSEDNSDKCDDEEETGSALPHPSFASEDLTEMLENCGVDEIGKALEDAEKLEEVATASIARLTPDKVCDALIKAWDAEQLAGLVKRVNAHLSTQTGTSPSSSHRQPITFTQPGL